MSKKNRNRFQQPPVKPPSVTRHPQAPAATNSPVLPETPATALKAIADAHNVVLSDATEVELDIALTAPPPTDAANLDLVAASKQICETIALLAARNDQLAKREDHIAELGATAHAREEELESRGNALSALALVIEEQRAAALQAEVEFRAREDELLVRETALSERELNAEAGFSAQRRISLKQLEDEGAILRSELSSARMQIAKERAEWEADRRAEEKHFRDEMRKAADSQQNCMAESERTAGEQLFAERELLAKDRLELKRRAVQVEIEREILREDREAFDERVARRAAHELEAANAKQMDTEARLASAQAIRDDLYEKLRLRDEAQRALGNRPLDEVKRELDSLTKERDALAGQLAKRPSHDVTERLAIMERAQEEWESERGRLMHESVAARTALARASIAVTEIETLRDQKGALESARDLLHAALEELRKDVDERIRRADGISPFPACSQMDAESELQTPLQMTDSIPDLKAFCEDLQHRIAVDPANPERVLSYELRDIRCFLAGLAMSRLHLLQGISGTGKTSLPLAVARALGAGSALVEVQAGWRDRQDLIGHFNAFERRFYESEFLQALYRAQCPRYSGLINIVVLDEMNLSHPEQYFADLLSALEQDRDLQKLDLMTAPVEPAPAHLRNGRTLRIPPNVWFVGTANHDETTKDFADKTYDRAHVMELPRNRAHFKPNRPSPRAPISFDAISSAFALAKSNHKDQAKEAYRFVDTSFADILGRRFGVGWGNRLERQMHDFVPVVVASGGSVGEAVDHILATKLLRKVRDRHDTRPEDFSALREQIAMVWPSLDSTTNAVRSMAIVGDELRRLGAEEDS